MTNDKTPEQAAERLRTCISMHCIGGETVRAGMHKDVNTLTNEYARGREEERNRIWEAVKRARSSAEFSHTKPGVLTGGITIDEARKIIFGGEK